VDRHARAAKAVGALPVGVVRAQAQLAQGRDAACIAALSEAVDLGEHEGVVPDLICTAKGIAGGLPLAQQRTAATLVTFILSLAVLVLLAVPLTLRRVVLAGSMLAGFALLFAVPAVRRFYALDPPGGELGATLLVAALGAGGLTLFWTLSRRS